MTHSRIQQLNWFPLGQLNEFIKYCVWYPQAFLHFILSCQHQHHRWMTINFIVLHFVVDLFFGFILWNGIIVIWHVLAIYFSFFIIICRSFFPFLFDSITVVKMLFKREIYWIFYVFMLHVIIFSLSLFLLSTTARVAIECAVNGFSNFSWDKCKVFL